MKFHGLEWFTTYESSKGRSRTELVERNADQIATDLVYRFGSNENFWVGGRFNSVTSQMINSADVTLERMAFSGGWFVTKNIMAKAEYVNQDYKDFATSDIRNGGNFHGLVLEGVVSF